MRRTVKYMFSSRAIVTDITGHIPVWCRHRLPYARAERTALKEGTIVSQYYSHFLFFIELVEIELIKCNYNMDILLDDCKIEIMKLPDKVRFAAIHSDISWLNSATLFTKNFKKKIEGKIGWPIYFAMPTREFCYMVNIKHKQSLTLLSSMFADIFRHEDLQLTREIFSMTDNGIRAVGRF